MLKYIITYSQQRLCRLLCQITKALTPLCSSLIGCTLTCFTMDLNNVFKNPKWKFLANESRSSKGKQQDE